MPDRKKTCPNVAAFEQVGMETVACRATISYNYFTMGDAGPSTISVGGGVDG